MLAKKFRLPIHKWQQEKKTTIARRSSFFIVKFRTNNLEFSRFGIIISAKVSKKAVARNKIKRTIFNFIRLKKLHLNSSRDILIIVLPLANQLTKKEIQEQLKQQLTVEI